MVANVVFRVGTGEISPYEIVYSLQAIADKHLCLLCHVEINSTHQLVLVSWVSPSGIGGSAEVHHTQYRGTRRDVGIEDRPQIQTVGCSQVFLRQDTTECGRIRAVGTEI